MTRRFRSAIVPAFLFLCLLIGGSAQGVWRNMVLQLLAVLLIAGVVVARDGVRERSSRQLLGLIILALLLLLAQLVPLPPDLWSSLPMREAIARGFDLLGQDRPWLPISLAPFATLETALLLLPPIAVVAAILRSRLYGDLWLAGAVLLGALAGVVLGALQLASGSDKSWYLYDYTNDGAVGFFANSNHLGTLLLAAIPFAVALFASAKAGRKNRGGSFGIAALVGGAILLLIVGIAINGSLSAAALAVPVIALSALLLPGGSHWRRPAIALVAVATVAAVILYSGSPLVAEIARKLDSVSVTMRQDIWQQSSEIAALAFPVGTGIGTFPDIYAMFENAASVDQTYVNHAHNDYLELLVETGLAGTVLFLLFAAWWMIQAVAIWRSPFSSAVQRAATIASATILAHSLVDFPLRTTAIAALFAMCVALMAGVARRDGDERNGPAPRHVTIG